MNRPARRIPGWLAAPGIPALLALALLGFGCWVARDRWDAGFGAEWLGYGLGGVAWYALGLLALAWCVSRVSVAPVGWRTILAIGLVYLPAALLLSVLIDAWAPPQVADWQSAGLAALGLLWLAWVLRRLGATPALPSLVVAAVFLAAFGWISRANELSAEVWYATGSDAADAADAADGALEDSSDRLLFGQPQRIDAALAAVAPRAAGRPNLFFVGFAGYGEQRVFAEEIRFAAQAVAQRYGTGTRSVTLVNDRRDVTEVPLATVVGLERVLQGVAQRMDVDEDVLFLVLASHGAEDPVLSVSLGDVPLEQLTGTALRQALDRSGIRWRVIVISACHAGAFIDDLEDEQTIVLTAAAAGNTSFGCSDDRDLTYFGEALFRDALPAAPTLRAAFDVATAAIRRRELREGATASDPQAFFGTEMARRWQRFEPSVVSARSDSHRR